MCCALKSGLMLTQDQYCFLSFTSGGETMLCAARTDRTLQEDTHESEPSISNSGCAQPALGPSLSYCLSQFLGPRPPPCSEHSPENLLASQLHPLLNPLQSCFHFTLQGCAGLPPTMPHPPPRVTFALAPRSSWPGQTHPPSCLSSLTPSLL